MKVICQTQKLSEACQIIQRSVSPKTSIPALEGILLKALGDELILTGYDMDLGINTSISARVNKPGSIIINAKTLCDILRYLPGESVVIEKQDERFKYMIRSGETEYTILGIDAADFPELPKIEDSYPIVVEQKKLREMIRQTIFAVAVNDSTKVVHTGIKFEITSGNIRLIALDGFRLAIRNEEIDYEGEEISFIVPSKTLSEIVKIMNDDEGTVSISIGKRHIIFEIGDYFIISRLLEGEFLNYKTAIPMNCSTTVRVSTKSMIECIERTSLIITDKIKIP
ncbi:MAG: DNA polymerase III subunit beta, partial [Clostridia bacterium]|nr:DNA polymerase III subunit beta [Clostridia bacterium]